jgi:hypothetical protein
MACGLIASLLPGLTAAQDLSTQEAARITGTIDVSQYFRCFPRLTAGRNTSIQKAPAPVLAELREREFGKAGITRCWLNLDEMWDYRTREYDFNYRIEVHKYDHAKNKARESWGGAEETNVRFHDYLQAFGTHSNAVMLTIRRYERDILDGKLGVTMEDWKEIFKKAVVHYRQVCPNQWNGVRCPAPGRRGSTAADCCWNWAQRGRSG